MDIKWAGRDKYGDFKIASKHWETWVIDNQQMFDCWTKLDWLRKELRENQQSDVTCVCFSFQNQNQNSQQNYKRFCFASKNRRNPTCPSHNKCREMDNMGYYIFEECSRQIKELQASIEEMRNRSTCQGNTELIQLNEIQSNITMT